MSNSYGRTSQRENENLSNFIAFERFDVVVFLVFALHVVVLVRVGVTQACKFAGKQTPAPNEACLRYSTSLASAQLSRESL